MLSTSYCVADLHVHGIAQETTISHSRNIQGDAMRALYLKPMMPKELKWWSDVWGGSSESTGAAPWLAPLYFALQVHVTMMISIIFATC